MSVCIILKLNPDEMTFVLGGEMALWTDDYCFVDQCFLYRRGKPDAWWMFGPESDSQFTESVSGIVSISGCKYSKISSYEPPPPPQLKSAPTELPAHFPVNKTIHPVISPPPPTYRFPQLQVHLPVKHNKRYIWP